MDGYRGNDWATAASIEPDGRLYAGDIATMDDRADIERLADVVVKLPA